MAQLSNTPLLGFPYPGSLDRPCDFDESWCLFTGALDDAFARFESALDRMNPAVPAAMLQLTTQISIGNGNAIPFDTVVIDTAGMTDLDSDLYGITIPIDGRYTIAGYNKQLTGGLLNQQISMTVGSPSTGIQHLILDRNVALGYGNVVDFDVFSFAAGDRITMTTFESGTTARTLLEAWMAVYWHADQEAP